MTERKEFTEKLHGIVELGVEKNHKLEVSEVENYFKEDQLSNEQMNLVYDYLLSQKIVVKGYVQPGGNVTEKTERKSSAEKEDFLTEDEKNFVKTYSEELEVMEKQDPHMASLLKKVLSYGKEMHVAGIDLGDLVQEGNMAFMALYAEKPDNQKELLAAAQDAMEVYIRSNLDEKQRDKKMVDKVNDLDEEIQKYADEMGRKITIDELAEHIHISEEEILDILKLAGEELKEEE